MVIKTICFQLDLHGKKNVQQILKYSTRNNMMSTGGVCFLALAAVAIYSGEACMVLGGPIMKCEMVMQHSFIFCLKQ